MLELRALAKATPYMTQLTYFTGRLSEEKETVIAVKELLSLVQSFPELLIVLNVTNVNSEENYR